MTKTYYLDKYINIIEINNKEKIIVKGERTFKQLGSITIEVNHPLFYHFDRSTFKVPIYSDYNSYNYIHWFYNFYKYLGIKPMDISIWVKSKFFDIKNVQ